MKYNAKMHMYSTHGVRTKLKYIFIAGLAFKNPTHSACIAKYMQYNTIIII